MADLCRAYGLKAPERILPAPLELLTVLRARESPGGLPLVYPDPPLGTEELSLVTEFAPKLTLTTPTRLVARR